MDHSDLRLTEVLLFGDASLDIDTNSSILNSTTDFVFFPKGFKSHSFELSISLIVQTLF